MNEEKSASDARATLKTAILDGLASIGTRDPHAQVECILESIESPDVRWALRMLANESDR